MKAPVTLRACPVMFFSGEWSVFIHINTNRWELFCVLFSLQRFFRWWAPVSGAEAGCHALKDLSFRPKFYTSQSSKLDTAASSGISPLLVEVAYLFTDFNLTQVQMIKQRQHVVINFHIRPYMLGVWLLHTHALGSCWKWRPHFLRISCRLWRCWASLGVEKGIFLRWLGPGLARDW